ncbi:MAG TPA: YaiI/YqxD family protein [Planctomycetaceae bacterium]|nr:YaiI/YqxD family protein [Planctomycetaceae bacterium]
MRIWIDADACPGEVKSIVFKAAHRQKTPVILVANCVIKAPPQYRNVESVAVSQDANAADRYIVEHSIAGDLAITADLPLAGDLVAKQVIVIDPRGEEYNADTISSRLSMRDFMDDMRGAGMVTGGAAPYNNQNKHAFASTFDRLYTRALRRIASKR